MDDSTIIKKWDIEIICDNVPLNFNEPTHPLPIVNISVAHLKSKIPPIIEVGIYIYCHINKGHYQLNKSPIKLFEFSTLSKFSFAEPQIEAKSFQFIYNCLVAGIEDFNKEVSKHPSILLNLPNTHNKIQQQIPSFRDARVDIEKIWRLNIQAN